MLSRDYRTDSGGEGRAFVLKDGSEAKVEFPNPQDNNLIDLYWPTDLETQAFLDEATAALSVPYAKIIVTSDEYSRTKEVSKYSLDFIDGKHKRASVELDRELGELRWRRDNEMQEGSILAARMAGIAVRNLLRRSGTETVRRDFQMIAESIWSLIGKPKY